MFYLLCKGGEILKNYLIFKEFNTLNYALIEELPVVGKAEENKEFIEVDGRNGFLTFDRDSYKPIDYSVNMVVNGKEKRDIIKKAFRGNGDLILSNDINCYYKGVISSPIVFDRQIREIFSCEVSFKLQPFGYVKNVEDITIVLPTTIINN